MNNGQHKVLLTVVLLLALSALLTGWIPDVIYTGYIKLRTDALPERVGEFHGKDIFYCQNESCLATYSDGSITNTALCPKCGGALDRASRAERVVLPPDTCILKKMYTDTMGREIPVTVVFSAENQRSIHRPQRCLPGQGFVIEKTRVVTIPLSGREPLKVITLSIRQQVGRDRKVFEYMTYAYWYIGGDYETSSHYDRLARTAADRIFHNRLDRWAYVSLCVSHGVLENPVPRLESFIAEFYPLIQLPPAARRSVR
jgi:EpsI family protein